MARRRIFDLSKLGSRPVTIVDFFSIVSRQSQFIPQPRPPSYVYSSFFCPNLSFHARGSFLGGRAKSVSSVSLTPEFFSLPPYSKLSFQGGKGENSSVQGFTQTGLFSFAFNTFSYDLLDALLNVSYTRHRCNRHDRPLARKNKN